MSEKACFTPTTLLATNKAKGCAGAVCHGRSLQFQSVTERASIPAQRRANVLARSIRAGTAASSSIYSSCYTMLLVWHATATGIACCWYNMLLLLV